MLLRSKVGQEVDFDAKGNMDTSKLGSSTDCTLLGYEDNSCICVDILLDKYEGIKLSIFVEITEGSTAARSVGPSVEAIVAETFEVGTADDVVKGNGETGDIVLGKLGIIIKDDSFEGTIVVSAADGICVSVVSDG